MRDFLGVYRREVTAYVVSPIPYLFAAIFTMVMAWIVFFSDIGGGFFLIGRATMDRFFEPGGFPFSLPYVLAGLVPALSMRLWAEEIRAGTVEHLMTMPVRTWQVVLGKYLAAFTVLVLSFMLTLTIPISIDWFGDLDWGPVLGGYLGAMLLGGALLALGVWLSALTRHQIVAFLVALVLGIAIVSMGTLARTGTLAELAHAVSPFTYFESMSRGVVDLLDLAYFIAFGAFFLYLNVQTIENRRVS